MVPFWGFAIDTLNGLDDDADHILRYQMRLLTLAYRGRRGNCWPFSPVHLPLVLPQCLSLLKLPLAAVALEHPSAAIRQVFDWYCFFIPLSSKRCLPFPMLFLAPMTAQITSVLELLPALVADVLVELFLPLLHLLYSVSNPLYLYNARI